MRNRRVIKFRQSQNIQMLFFSVLKAFHGNVSSTYADIILSVRHGRYGRHGRQINFWGRAFGRRLTT